MGSMKNGMSSSQRMKGAEILVVVPLLLLLMLCSLPYAGGRGQRGYNLGGLKTLLLTLYTQATRWNDEVEYSTSGGCGKVIEETFSSDERRDMFLHEVDLVTKAAIKRVPPELRAPSVCFEKYNGKMWVSGLKQEGGGVGNNYHELQEHVVPIVRHLIEEKKLEHFVLVRYRSQRYSIALGVVSASMNLNSGMVDTPALGQTVLDLSQCEDDHVYELVIQHN